MAKPQFDRPSDDPHLEQAVGMHLEPFKSLENCSTAPRNWQSTAQSSSPGVDVLGWNTMPALWNTSEHGNPIEDLHPNRSLEIPCLSPSERSLGTENRSTTDSAYFSAHSQAQGMYHDVNPAHSHGRNTFGDPGTHDTERHEDMRDTSYNAIQADNGAVGLAARDSYLSVPLLDDPLTTAVAGGMEHPTQAVPYQRASIPSMAHRNFGSPPFSSSPDESPYYSKRNLEQPTYGLMPPTFNPPPYQEIGTEEDAKGWYGAGESSPIFDPTLTTFGGSDLNDQPGTMQATESTFPALKESTTAFAPDEEQHPPEQRKRYRLPPRRRALEPDEKEQVALKRQLGLVCERHRRTKRKCNCRSPEELRALQLSPP